MSLQFISINNTQIACYQRKSSKTQIKSVLPPIVLIHGYTGSALHHFKYEIENYARMFQTDVLAFDHRGHGNSDPGAYETLDYDIHFNDFEKIIEYFGYQDVILIGASFGGVIALRYAIKYPDRVKKLIVISTTAESSPGMTNALITINKTIDSFFAMDCNIKKLDPESMKFLSILMKIHFETSPYNKLKFFRYFINLFVEKKFSLLEDIQNNITCPVLILHGDIDYVEVDNAKKMHSCFKNSKLIIIPQYGHLPQRKNPELVKKYISEFLQD